MSFGPGSWAEDPGEQAYSERGSPENLQGMTLQVGGDDVREAEAPAQTFRACSYPPPGGVQLQDELSFSFEDFLP